MNSKWPSVKLGEYCLKIGSGATPRGGSKVYLDAGEFTLIRSQNIYNAGFNKDGLVYITNEAAEKLKNVEVSPLDILLNITGDSVARVCIAPQEHLPARVNQHVAIVRPIPSEFDANFLRYFLTSPSMQDELLSIASSGATRNALTKGDIESLNIPKPEINTQKKISHCLLTFDNKIQLNKRINQTLEAIAQATFKSWFIDFDPVKAKMAVLDTGGTEEEANLAAMRVISSKSQSELEAFKAKNPDKYTKLYETAKLFPSEMEDSELGEMPKGWCSLPFGECLNKTIGGDWGKEHADEKHVEKIKILRGTDIPNAYDGSYTNIPTRFVEPKKLLSRELEAFDIIIEISGGSPKQPTGRSLLITHSLLKDIGRSAPASFCRLLRPKSKYLSLLLALHLQIIYKQGKMWSYQNQSTGISNFQTSRFLQDELVVYPSDEITKLFFKFALPLLGRERNSENQTLVELRDTLLPRLLSGAIELPINEECELDGVANG